MAKVLYIKANPKEDSQSYTFQMSEAFISEYKNKNPQDEIITLDLYKEQIPFLDGKGIQDMFQGKNEKVLHYAKQFAEVDKYIVAAPMWNLSFPAILKAYFDHVVLAGVTFKYTESGSVGLLAGKNKKAVHIVARGGLYSEGPATDFEMGDRYIRTILGFMGIESIETITTELTGVLQGEELQGSVQKSIDHAKEIAKTF